MTEHSKLEKVMKLIDEIADYPDSHRIKELEAELSELTGKVITADDCLEYWSWTSLEELAQSFLMPEPEATGLNDYQLAEIIQKIYECEYSEAETEFQLKVLEKETGLPNVSDYIFYPDEIGLDENADISEITAKILADRLK